MLEYYLIALLSRGQVGDLASSALPDAPVRPHREGRLPGRDRRSRRPSPTDHGQVTVPSPADTPVAARPDGPPEWDPCPCGQFGVSREDRHGCAARVKELFPLLDQELDAWEAAHGWLYR
jgi:hypothetical protein